MKKPTPVQLLCLISLFVTFSGFASSGAVLDDGLSHASMARPAIVHLRNQRQNAGGRMQAVDSPAQDTGTANQPLVANDTAQMPSAKTTIPLWQWALAAVMLLGTVAAGWLIKPRKQP